MREIPSLVAFGIQVVPEFETSDHASIRSATYKIF